MFPVKQTLLIAIGTTVALVATAAYALPGPTACALVGLAGLNALGDGVVTDSKSEADHRRYIQLVRDARERIEATFGTPESKPIVVIFNGSDGFGPFKLNGYGSTQMVGSRACVMVGPKGQNIDVVAHELMHGELHYRVGPVHRFLQVPTWFDEGIAMQVDYRSRYLLSPQEAVDSDYVRALTTASSFFAGDDEALTRNYASAKAVVAAWVVRVEPATFYSRLLRLKSGESVAEVVPERELTPLQGLPT
jgi:hypothetical protein